jgi:hypothetical protein
MNAPFDAPMPLRDLAHHYARAVDMRDGDALCAVFTPGGEVAGFGENPISYAGHQRLREMTGELAMFEQTMHKVYNQLFTRSEDNSVTGLTYCTASHLLKGEEATLLDMEIVYHDRFAKDDSQWRFAHRALEVLWVEFRSVQRFTPEIMNASLGNFR